MGAPYITITDALNYLGTPTLSGTQTTAAQAKVNAAIAYVNRVTLQAWNLDPITGELYDLQSRQLLLQSTPVASVEQVQVRSRIVGDTPEVLTAGTDYELLDLTRGLILFDEGYGHSAIAIIDYTPNRPVPADIVDACTTIAGESIYPILNPDRRGITKAQVDRETVIQYSAFGQQLLIPQSAQDVLLGYRPMIWG